MVLENRVDQAIDKFFARQKKNEEQIDIIIDADYAIIINRRNKTPLKYIPEPGALIYHRDGTNYLVKHTQGQFGSGKSVLSIMDFLFNPPPQCLDGIVRQRSIMCRSTYRELATTTIRTYLDWFEDSGVPAPGKIKKYVQSPLPTNHARYNVINNITNKKYILDWEVNFLAFEHETDIEKLKSIDATDGFWNEVSGVIKEIYTDSLGRTGRYPKRIELDVDDPDYKLPIQLKSDTNPPSKNSWLYDTFEVTKPNGFKIYRQPPGLIKNSDGHWITNPQAPNLKNLPKDYYLGLMQNRSEESIRVYCCGEYGIVAAGSPVYPEYNDDWHSVDTINYEPSSGFYLGWDFGLTPCLLVCQLVNGQFRVIKEFCSENFGIENLIDTFVIPWFNQNKIVYSKQRSSYQISVADPAGNARSAKNIFEPTLIETISKKFVPTDAADSNKTEVRLEAVRQLLNRNINGKPALLISRDGCPILREGFLGKYYITEAKVPGQIEKQLTGIPVKTHPHSEPQDCLQYVALKVSALGLHNKKSDAIESVKNQITGMRK